MKPRTFCRHFLRKSSRCFTASWRSINMNRVDQRYSIGSSPSAERMPGVDSIGKPSIATVWTNLLPMRGITPVHISTPPMMESRYIGFEGSTTGRSEEHTSELQSLMRISYAVFCLKKNKSTPITKTPTVPHIKHEQQKLLQHT